MTYPNPLVTQERVRRLVRRRRRARRAKVASLTVLLVVVAGAGAVGVDRAVVYGQRLWAEHHRPPPAPAPTTAPASTTTIPGPPLCIPGQLRAYLYGWRITAGTLYEVVALAGTSTTPCTLAGYVAFSVSSPGGGALPAPVRHDPALNGPGGASAAPVSVVSGQLAWFELTYPVACATVLADGQPASGAAGECYQGASLGVIVPRATTALQVAQPLGFTYGVAGFAVGAFEPGPPPPSPPVGQQ